MAEEVRISAEEAQRLLASGNADAVLCLLWLRGMRGCGTPPMDTERMNRAVQVLRQLALLPQEHPPVRETRPAYSEETVAKQLNTNRTFQTLVGECQRILGRVLSTEELKSLLSIHDYLRLPDEVTAIVVSYCVQRARARGGRMPGMRTVEKEAYIWSDLGIETVEAAVPYMQNQLARQSRVGRICAKLQISGRQLTQAETKYVLQWIDWGFPDDSIYLAYEKTCLNTGDLKWPYLHSILASWNEKGLHTVEEIRAGDGGGKGKQNGAKQPVPDLEREAVRKLMQEG